ncbi:hypothetical protein LguiB_012664 [Lonicera macranthoides]
MKFSCGRMITLIALLGRRVTNENILKSPRIKFAPMVGMNMNKCNITKYFGYKVVGDIEIGIELCKDVCMTLQIKHRCGKSIYDVSCS